MSVVDWGVGCSKRSAGPPVGYIAITLPLPICSGEGILRLPHHHAQDILGQGSVN